MPKFLDDIIASGGSKVGVGTTTPTSLLDIFSTGTSTLTLSYDGGGNSGSTIDFSLINASVSQPITTQIKAIDDGAFRQDLSFLTKTSASGSSNLSTRMMILASGNVGIGTTSPSFKLDVEGDIGMNGKLYHNGDHNTYIGFESDNIKLRTGGVDALELDSSQNATFSGLVKTTAASGFVVGAAVGMSMSYYTDVSSSAWGIFSSNNHGDTIISTNLKINASHDVVTNQAHAAIKGSGVVFTGNGHHAGAGAIAMYALGNGTASAGTSTAEENYSLLITDTAATFSGSVSVADYIHWDLNSGEYSGDPRAVVMGYSGGNYGSIGYNIGYTSTSNTHNRVFNDIPTRMDLYDGILLYSSAAGSAGTSIAWTELLQCQTNNFEYKSNDIFYSGYAGTATFGGALTVNPGSSAVSTIKLRRDTTADSTIVGDIEFDTTAATNTDDRIALIRARTSAGAGTSRGGEMLLYTRQSNSANFNTTTYSKDGNWVFPGEVEATSLDINGNADISGNLTGVDTLTAQNFVGTSNYHEFGNATGSVSNNGTWNGRLNVAGTSHARLDVKSVSDGIITTMFAHIGQGAGKLGTYSNHPVHLVVNGTSRATLDSSANFAVAGELEGGSLDINGNADITGNLYVNSGGIVLQQAYNLNLGVSGYDLKMPTSTSLVLTTAGTTALTLDNSQNATFAGTINSGNITVGNASTETESRFYHSDGTYMNIHGYGIGMSRVNSYIRPTSDGSQTLWIGAASKTWNYVSLDANQFQVQKDGSTLLNVSSSALTIADSIVGKGSIEEWVGSRGENLFSNGNGLLGNIVNMPGFTFDGSNANNSPGSFKWTGTGTPFTSEFIPVDTGRKYKMQYDAKTENGVGKYYGFTACYDVDGSSINAAHHMYRANTLTTLAVDLVNGATTMTLTNSANWNNAGTAGQSNHLRSLIIWNYTNSFGYTYPEETYSRNWYTQAWDPGDINFTTHVVTLRVAWAGGTVAAGTKVSNGSSGGTFKYNIMSNKTLTTDWVRQSGYMDGVDYSGTNVYNKFPPGTAKVKLGWLMNYQNVQPGEVAWFTNIQVNVAASEDNEIRDAVERATDSNTFTDADHTALASTVTTANAALPKAGGTMTGNLVINTSTNQPIEITGTNSTYTAIAVQNTGTGDAGIFFDAMNGDLVGSNYGFIGQKDEGELQYDIGPSSPNAIHSFTGGGVTITHNDGLFVKSTTNGGGAQIKFSDLSASNSYAQAGHIKYYHADGSSYGSGNVFVIGGTEASMTILADGKLMYSEGIYSKPASGTGAGTRVDTNWNTAYTHSQAAHAPSNADATSSTNVVSALNGNLGTVTFGDANDEINIQGNLTVTGVTTMSGGTVINTTTNTAIKDTTIFLNAGITGSGAGGSTPANVADIGLILDRGSHGNVYMGWDESEDEFIFVKTTSEGSDDAGAATGGGTPGIVIDNEETDFLHVKVGSLESVGVITSGNSNVLTAGTAASSFPSGLQNSNVTSVSGNAGSVTNGVYTTGTQTIGGAKTFSGATSIGSTLASNEYSLVTIQGRNSHMFSFGGQSDHTLTLNCGSYYQAEVTITAHQTNGGTYNNIYIRGIWSNNHTSHHWDELERVGSMTGNTITITNGQNGSTTASGQLAIVHDNTQGDSFGLFTVNVIEHFGSSTHVIS